MKIAVNATFLNDKPTGVGIFTLEVVRRLCRDLHSVIVFSPRTSLFPRACLQATPRSGRGSTKTRHNLARFAYLNTVLPIVMKRQKASVLFCPMTEFPFIPGVPMVVTVHDLHPLRFPSQFGLASVHFRMMLNHLRRLDDPIIVPSRYVKDDLLRRTGLSATRVTIIQLAYDDQLFWPRDPEQKEGFLRRRGIASPYILWVGTLLPYKNLGLVLAAFQRIRDDCPHCLVVAGRPMKCGPPFPIDRRIIYLDYVPRSDLPALYSYCDAYVQPSLAEGFGLTTLEAMACGAPVMVSRAGALPDVAASAALLFDPHDPSALAEQLRKLLNDKALQRELGQRGIQRAATFSWDKTGDQVQQVLKAALFSR